MKIVIHPKYQDAADFVAKVPIIFDTHGDTIHQGRNHVKRFLNDKDEWVVKRYKRPNIFQKIVYTFFKKSKAERAYLYAWALLSKEIATPEGVAYIEKKERGLITDCYFISVASTDSAVYPELVKTDHYDTQLADALAAFFVQMHNKGVLHGDPNLNNILFHRENNGNVSFSVIDTNRSIFKDSLTYQERINNLKRVTHRRDLLQYITTQYAKLQKWNISESVRRVMRALDCFERQRKIKHIIKRKS